MNIIFEAIDYFLRGLQRTRSRKYQERMAAADADMEAELRRIRANRLMSANYGGGAMKCTNCGYEYNPQEIIEDLKLFPNAYHLIVSLFELCRDPLLPRREQFIEVDNEVFSLSEDCQGCFKSGCTQCSENRPLFVFKSNGWWARWYKHPGRGFETRDEPTPTEMRHMIDTCIQVVLE